MLMVWPLLGLTMKSLESKFTVCVLLYGLLRFTPFFMKTAAPLKPLTSFSLFFF
jgi:hypothetical protein